MQDSSVLSRFMKLGSAYIVCRWRRTTLLQVLLVLYKLPVYTCKLPYRIFFMNSATTMDSWFAVLLLKSFKLICCHWELGMNASSSCANLSRAPVHSGLAQCTWSVTNSLSYLPTHVLEFAVHTHTTAKRLRQCILAQARRQCRP